MVQWEGPLQNLSLREREQQGNQLRTLDLVSEVMTLPMLPNKFPQLVPCFSILFWNTITDNFKLLHQAGNSEIVCLS